MNRIRNLGLSVISGLLAVAQTLAHTLYAWARKSIAPRGDLEAFLNAASTDMTTKVPGNGIVILLEDGKVAGAFHHSIGAPVSNASRFQMGSLSKWVAAWGVMTLVDVGQLDLDAPVSRYLTRWKLPESAFNNEGVTVRRLLSHTAGLLDLLGYDGFADGETIQTLEQSLDQASDTMPGNTHGRVRVEREPGSEYHYSGGGFTLLQLLIEEVSGRSFNDYMTSAVFEPLGMSSATFRSEDALPALAEIFDEKGEIAPHYTYTALAAASLYASGDDIVRFLQAHLIKQNGLSAGAGSLSTKSIRSMRHPHPPSKGWASYGRWGLGASLYAPTKNNDFLVGHIGGNRPASSTSAIIDPSSGDGIVVFATGRPAYAIELASEWVYWKTGVADVFMLRADRTKFGIRAGIASLCFYALIAKIRLSRVR